MCDATLIAITAAQSALQIGAAQEASARQETYYLNNRTNAIAARDLKVSQENLKLTQQEENLTDEQITKNIEAMKLKSKQIVSAGEAGVAGGVLDAIVMNTEATNLRNQDAVSAEKRGLRDQTKITMKGFDAEAINRINSVKRGDPVDPLGIIATNALTSYGSYHMATTYP